MSDRRAISALAAITLGLIAAVLGLGVAAHSAAASAEVSRPDPVPTERTTIGVGPFLIEPGALALLGLSGVVACWPGGARRVRREDRLAALPDLPEAGEGAGLGDEVLSSAA